MLSLVITHGGVGGPDHVNYLGYTMLYIVFMVLASRCFSLNPKIKLKLAIGVLFLTNDRHEDLL